MEKKENQKENIRLDAILKLLFMVSDPLVIKMINYFFNERFDERQKLKVHFKNTESVDEDMNLKRADFLVDIDIKKFPCYHIEFQLNPSPGMSLRMFQYGYREATGQHPVPDEDPKTVCFPKQMVLYLEKRKRIPDDMKLKVIFPLTDQGEQSIIYNVLVKKAWEITKEEKIEKGLYSLLPLEIFKLRKQVEKTKKNDKEEFFKLSNQIKNATMMVAEIATKLCKEGKIQEEDHLRIIDATGHLFRYFSNNYADLELGEEVPHMLESICENYKNQGMQEGIQKGIQKGMEKGERNALYKVAKKMLKNRSDLNFIRQITELPLETIEKLEKEVTEKKEVTNIK